MSRIDVSIVVPTYNGAAYLDECLDSIARQDLDGVEVLVNDDGSTDDSVAIARRHAGRIAVLRVHENPERLGAVANVNRCLRLARGRWVKPVFQDDLLDPGGLTALLAARRRGVPVVVGARTYRFEGGVPDWQRQACENLVAAGLTHRFASGPLAADAVAEVAAETVADRRPQLNFVGEPVAVLLDRRAALRAGGFDDGYAQLWDYELLVRLAMRRGLVVVADPVATFRVHGASETARNLAGSAFHANVVDRLRLLVAYAMGRPYGPVRAAAVRHQPVVDLTALAMGSAWAARRVAEELPVEARAEAHATLDELTSQLPGGLQPPWGGAYAASRYAVELLHELSSDVDAAVADLYRHEPLAVDLAVPPPAAPSAAVPPPEAPPTDTEPADPPAQAAPPEESPPAPVAPVPGRRRGPVARLAGAARALRSNQWWNHMLGPLVAVALLQVGWRQVEPGEALARVVALLVSAIALAAYGYVVNDAADVEVDRRAGKPNSMAALPVAGRVGVVGALAVVGALPWLVVPLEAPALAVLAGIYLLPLAYSPRPLRLKEQRVLGPVADASNAFVLPSLFTVALFAPLGPAVGPAPLMVVGVVAWAAGFGLRAILLHQVADASNDRASGTTTFVTTVGEARAVRLLRRFLLPLELVGLALLAATVAWWAAWLVVGGLVLFALFHAARLRGILDRSLAVTTVERGLGLYWTQIWPALLLSGALAVGDLRFLVGTGLVLVLFGPRLGAGLRALRASAANERLRWRLRHG